MSREFRAGLLGLEVKKPRSTRLSNLPFGLKMTAISFAFPAPGKGFPWMVSWLFSLGKTEERTPSTAPVPTDDAEHHQARKLWQTSPFTNHCYVLFTTLLNFKKKKIEKEKKGEAKYFT